MADNTTLCLVEAMDHLWFYQIILFPEPILLHCPKTPQRRPESTTHLSSKNSLLPLPDQEIPSDSSQITPQKDDCNNEDKLETPLKERPTSLNLTKIKTKTRSHSSSPSTQKRSKKLVYSSSMGTLPRTTTVMNFKSLWDLELEEVKGFMDLGFTFKKEQITKRMMIVVPGLQRLGGLKTAICAVEVDHKDGEFDDEGEEEKKIRGVMRPYLSEAWLIKRPDSPLLNLRIRIPTASSAAADMKKHLMFWARIVASEILQES